MVDGKSMLRALRETLLESSTSNFMDDRTSYDYLYRAAIDLVGRTNAIKAEQSITTAAEQSAYTLDADFMKLYLRDNDNEFFLKYNDGSADTFIRFRSYEEIIYENNSSSQLIPNYFTILNDTVNSQISSTATSAGAVSGSVCVLTDSTAPFTDVSPGDIVHNTTDGSDGLILSVTSTSALVTVLFDGADNDWSSSDAYVIQPQARLKLVFDPATSTASHTVTLYYIQKPDPVFSDYGMYNIQSQYLYPLVHYAAWLYKYRDSEPNFGDAFYQHWDNAVRKNIPTMHKSRNKRGFSVNLRRR